MKKQTMNYDGSIREHEEKDTIVVQTLQRGTPTPEHPVPIEHYIQFLDQWYKLVTDKEELKDIENYLNKRKTTSF